jgi:hypothetical protein
MSRPIKHEQPDYNTERLSSTEVLIIFHSADNDYLRQVKMRLGGKTTRRITEASSAQSIAAQAKGYKAPVLMFCVRTENDLEIALNTLTELQHLIKSKALRVIGASDVQQPGAIALLREKGADVFPMALEWEWIQKKIERSFKTFFQEEATEPPPIDWIMVGKLKISLGSGGANKTDAIAAVPLEFQQGTLVLSVEAGVFNQAQKVQLTIQDETRKDIAPLTVLTEVTDITRSNGFLDAVSITMGENLQNYLKTIKEDYSHLQTQVADFMKTARGW